MAVIQDNSSLVNGTADVATQTLLLTITTGACLVVAGMSPSAVSFSACNAQGVAMTMSQHLTFNNGQRTAALFTMTAAPSGIVTISCMAVGGVAKLTLLCAVSYVGQRTTATPFGNFAATASATGTAVTNVVISISATVGDMAVGFFAQSGTGTVVSGSVVRSGSVSGAGGKFHFVQTAGSALVLFTASSGTLTQYAFNGLAIISSSTVGGAVSPFNQMKTGVGK
jgi:hypothetical protein